MKTIIISVPMGRGVKDMLRSDVLKILKSNNVRIILLTPAFNEEDFIEEFKDENVVIRELKRYKPSICEKALESISNQILWNASVSYNRTMEIKDNVLKRNHYHVYLRHKIMRAVFGKNKKHLKTLEKLDLRFFKDPYYADLFNEYKPSLLVTTGTVDFNEERPLMKRARENKVPIVSRILSWDNLTKARRPPVKADKLIVWNNNMKKEAIEYWNFSGEDVYVTGSPQFDYYYDKSKFCSKKEFFKEMGLDLDKKLITYIVSGAVVLPNQMDAIEMLIDAISNNEISYPAQLLIRKHQGTEVNQFKELEKYENVVVDDAGCHSKSFVDRWNPKVEDMKHFAETLLHSDVVVGAPSTVAIDSAVFDTPIVNLYFDGYEKREYYDSVVRIYDYIHYQRVVRTGGIRIAENREEMIENINRYLKDPTIDREGRKKMVEEQCYLVDGRSEERIANCILDLLKEQEIKK